MPILMFWVLDAFFLCREHAYRRLYDEVRKRSEDDIDFSMAISDLCEGDFCWLKNIFSPTEVAFYLGLVAVTLLGTSLL